MSKKDNNFDFKKTFDELEEINEWFSGENIDLSVALTKYKRGVELVKEAKKNLKETENEFKEIQKELEND